MIALRLVFLLLAAGCTLAVLGLLAADLPASAGRLWVASVFAALAPLFWPGVEGRAKRTALRVLAWSGAVTGLALVVMLMAGRASPSAAEMGALALMLWALLVVVHALAAALQTVFSNREETVAEDDTAEADVNSAARQRAGVAAALVLALWGSLPLWLGPTAERLSSSHDWALDAVVAASPLTHLAVASGNDLLRNPWLYQYASLAALPVTYPSLASLGFVYSAACTLLLAAWFVRHRAATRS